MMITKALFDFGLWIISWLLSFTWTQMPQDDINSMLTDAFTGLAWCFQQANNFAHFLLGDWLMLILPIVISLLLYKYLIYPILTLVRSVFVNGNN